MRERGQATAEYAGIGLVVLALLQGVANVARRSSRNRRATPPTSTRRGGSRR